MEGVLAAFGVFSSSRTPLKCGVLATVGVLALVTFPDLGVVVAFLDFVSAGVENISCMASVTGVDISAFFPPRLGVLKSLFIASCPGVLGVFLVLLLVGESVRERQNFSTASIGHEVVEKKNKIFGSVNHHQ